MSHEANRVGLAPTTGTSERRRVAHSDAGVAPLQQRIPRADVVGLAAGEDKRDRERPRKGPEPEGPGQSREKALILRAPVMGLGTAGGGRKGASTGEASRLALDSFTRPATIGSAKTDGEVILGEFLHWLVTTVGVGAVAGALTVAANYALRLWESRPRLWCCVLEQKGGLPQVISLQVWNRSAESLLIREVRIVGAGSPKLVRPYGGSDVIVTGAEHVLVKRHVPPCAPYAQEVPSDRSFWPLQGIDHSGDIKLQVRIEPNIWWWRGPIWEVTAVNMFDVEG